LATITFRNHEVDIPVVVHIRGDNAGSRRGRYCDAGRNKISAAVVEADETRARPIRRNDVRPAVAVQVRG
jgi:hypothetical protein